MIALTFRTYVISNFAVWLAGNLGYPTTLEGLFTCFAAAVPFFEKGLASDLLFSAIFFSIPVMIAQVRGAVEHKRAAV